MNELNDMGYDIENNVLVETETKKEKIVKETVKQDKPVELSHSKSTNNIDVEEVVEPVKKIVESTLHDEPIPEDTISSIMDLSDNDPSGNNLVLGKINIE